MGSNRELCRESYGKRVVSRELCVERVVCRESCVWRELCESNKDVCPSKQGTKLHQRDMSRNNHWRRSWKQSPMTLTNDMARRTACTLWLGLKSELLDSVVGRSTVWLMHTRVRQCG